MTKLTPANIAYIKANPEKSIRDLQKELNVSRHQVMTCKNHLGIKAKPEGSLKGTRVAPLTDKEKEYVRDNYKTTSIRNLAKYSGVSYSRIQYYLQTNNLKRELHSHKKAPKQEVKQLKTRTVEPGTTKMVMVDGKTMIEAHIDADPKQVIAAYLKKRNDALKMISK
jgi:transposase-like protein